MEKTKPIERAPPVQLPEDGFDHPFQESYGDEEGPRQGKEHPRTVSGPSRAALSSYILPSDRRATDVCSL